GCLAATAREISPSGRYPVARGRTRCNGWSTSTGRARRPRTSSSPSRADFGRPSPDLLDAVAAWNADAYARTGVWAVAATFDHYVQLLHAYRRALPVRRFDPKAYWTGFYAKSPSRTGGAAGGA